jgi:PHD/YefM family antitoxin component YafN of YafNO toxin-antitoxin module
MELSVPELVPISEMRQRQTEIIELLNRNTVVLTHHGKAAAVLVKPEAWNRLLQRLEDKEDVIAALQVELAVARGETDLREADIDSLEAMARGETVPS